MLRSIICDYSDAYILVKGTITVANTAVADAANIADKKVVLKIFALFINYKSRMKKTQVDDVHDIDVEMPMYRLTRCSCN